VSKTRATIMASNMPRTYETEVVVVQLVSAAIFGGLFVCLCCR